MTATLAFQLQCNMPGCTLADKGARAVFLALVFSYSQPLSWQHTVGWFPQLVAPGNGGVFAWKTHG